MHGFAGARSKPLTSRAQLAGRFRGLISVIDGGVHVSSVHPPFRAISSLMFQGIEGSLIKPSSVLISCPDERLSFSGIDTANMKQTVSGLLREHRESISKFFVGEALRLR